jgi:hypothetical protein
MFSQEFTGLSPRKNVQFCTVFSFEVSLKFSEQSALGWPFTIGRRAAPLLHHPPDVETAGRFLFDSATQRAF